MVSAWVRHLRPGSAFETGLAVLNSILFSLKYSWLHSCVTLREASFDPLTSYSVASSFSTPLSLSFAQGRQFYVCGGDICRLKAIRQWQINVKSRFPDAMISYFLRCFRVRDDCEATSCPFNVSGQCYKRQVHTNQFNLGAVNSASWYNKVCRDLHVLVLISTVQEWWPLLYLFIRLLIEKFEHATVT